MIFREATHKDISSIAHLHALSWQQNYSQVLSANYLNDNVFNDRIDIWRLRLNQPKTNQFVLLAENNGVLCGFICIYGHHHCKYGTIIDNLHVDSESKGKGLGTALIKAGATWAYQHFSESSIYLEVLQNNIKARGFYESLGANNIAQKVWHTPCGNKINEYIYHWQDIENLINQC
jgi:ribosomal protein S18 acetylase RimI-like enzyme